MRVEVGKGLGYRYKRYYYLKINVCILRLEKRWREIDGEKDLLI